MYWPTTLVIQSDSVQIQNVNRASVFDVVFIDAASLFNEQKHT